jgi:hypothetical protein
MAYRNNEPYNDLPAYHTGDDMSIIKPLDRHVFATCRRIRHIVAQRDASIAANLKELGYGR